VTALLELEQARIDCGGAVLIDGLTLSANGESLGLVGAWEPLFALLAGRARLVSGSARIRGSELGRSVADGRIGLALAEVTLPEAWTALAYLEQSAELAGIARRQTRSAARRALAELELAHLESRRISTLTAAEKRALLIAHATLGAPEVLAIEAPLSGLDARSEALVSEVLGRAWQGRSLIVSVPEAVPIGAGRALLDRVSELLVLEAGTLIARGPASEAIREQARYSVTVTRLASELVERLAELGVAATLTPPAASGTRLIVELGAEHTTDDLLGAALAVGAPIIELLPYETGAQQR
jgi:ABC-type multidrug transport system ATPase subunit